MIAFISIKYHADNRNRARIEAISSALEQQGYTTRCVVRDIEQWGAIELDSEMLMRRTFEEIDASAVCIVDLTEKGVGIGIEAGYAYAKRIPIIVIAQQGSDVSTTLQGIAQRVVVYSAIDELGDMLRNISTISDEHKLMEET
jgi:nucleoside 2-deoxyribosyltransferase